MRGPISVFDMRRHMDAVAEMGGQRNCEIIDARLAEPMFTAKELPMLANHARRLFGRCQAGPRVAVLDQDDLVTFGLCRIFSMLVAPWITFRVFDEMEAAVAFVEAAIAAKEWPNQDASAGGAVN
jgi:hypothetical protein